MRKALSYRHYLWAGVSCLGLKCGLFGPQVWAVWASSVGCLGLKCGLFGPQVWAVWASSVPEMPGPILIPSPDLGRLHFSVLHTQQVRAPQQQQ
ncbi:hypothetical protein XELAEV_18033016mg [Xenopus laevis]|uniref:Uncharacterized protein n=1 Tax=Xenopus laevis TaxID=8355 RepID=A0A974CJ68_XENLA|nr:hypothetical protein XELAEV_18033016mg [Xenopus laevis]